MANTQMVGVAKALLIDYNDNLIGEGVVDTLDNSSIEFGTSNTEIRGGGRNKLIDVFYHTPTGSATISNVSFNLDVVAANLGANAPAFGTSIFQSETITLSGDTGTVSHTPMALKTGTVGWVCYLGETSKVTFTGSTFTAPVGVPSGATVLVTYYYNNTNAKYIEIPASIIPQRIRVVLTCALSTNQTSTGITGYAQWDIGVFQLAGSQTINMTPDGYATTELTGMMLEDNANGCVGVATEVGGGRYAKATLIMNDVTWHDKVIGLAIADGDFALGTTGSKTLKVYAVTPNSSFLADNAELTFASGTTATATVGAHTGLVSAMAGGTSLISVFITDKSTVEASCTVTVS